MAPIQLAIRLLIPAGSRLLELADVRELTGVFDEAALVYRWKHPDARVDELCEHLQGIVNAREKNESGSGANLRANRRCDVRNGRIAAREKTDER